MLMNQEYEEYEEYLESLEMEEKLSEQELSDLLDYEIDCQKGECRRWQMSVKSIIKLCDRYFAIDWERGLTEMQENEFFEQPYEVKKVEYEKLIKVTEWVDVKEGKEENTNE